MASGRIRGCVPRKPLTRPEGVRFLLLLSSAVWRLAVSGCTLIRFISLYFGRLMVGDTPENMGECVGLIETWLDTNLKPHVWGDAKALLLNADPKVYRVTDNKPDNYPPLGAIVVWGAAWGQGHGHCAIAVAANSSRLAVFEQNNPAGSPPILATHDYSGVLGWLTF
jgi:hypothetical protein